MKLTVRRSSDNEWGFVETYKKNIYFNTDSINVVTGVGKDAKMKEPFALRGGNFVPLSQINQEMPLEQYMRAKKPVYCKIKDGFIVSMKVVINSHTGEYVKESSDATIYTVNRSSVLNGDCGEVSLVSVLEVPEEVKNLINGFMEEIAKSDNRVDFLKSRFAEVGSDVDDLAEVDSSSDSDEELANEE
jgi:hypothetical protein